MNTFYQYIPGFCEGFKPVTINFSTTDELLSSPVVVNFTTGKDFSHFIMRTNLLVAVYETGDIEEQWVVGRVAHPEGVEFPQ